MPELESRQGFYLIAGKYGLTRVIMTLQHLTFRGDSARGLSGLAA